MNTANSSGERSAGQRHLRTSTRYDTARKAKKLSPSGRRMPDEPPAYFRKNRLPIFAMTPRATQCRP